MNLKFSEVSHDIRNYHSDRPNENTYHIGRSYG